MKFATKAVHAGVEPDPSTGAIMTPIFQTSTYVQKSPGDHQGYEYARTQNPTRHALETSLAALENGQHGICYSSGMAAMNSILQLLKPGDEIVSARDVYGGSYRIIDKVYKKFGLVGHFIDMTDFNALKAAVNENTKLIWLETPSNPLLQVVDLVKICGFAAEKGIWTCVDNTFASPFLQNPLDHGATMITHSITKYIAGHSDVVMGCVVTNDSSIAEDLRFLQNAVGSVPGPMDCFLTLRGIKTLHLRMDYACKNAKKIAKHLETHPKVATVIYPGLKTNPYHRLAKKQMKDFGAMVSFELLSDTKASLKKFLTGLKLFALAESLGGVESLVGHPATMTHASIPRKERIENGLNDGLIRLSVGIENCDDLIEDLENALARL